MAETLILAKSAAVGPIAWRLSLFGSFQLLDPLGIPVTLATRKIQGLIAVLALNRDYGVTREDAGEILWPGRPADQQRANLRQALAQLRKSIGESALDPSRTHCRLATGFALVCDYDRVEFRASNAFMPNQEGEWFEQIRIESSADSEPVGERQSMVGYFFQTLSWFAANDSRGLFQMLRASPALTRGIKYTDLIRLVTSANPEPSTLGWASYWRGASETDLQVCARLLRFAFDEAKKQNDSHLASEVCLELGKVYSRTGQFQKADEIASLAEAIANESGAKSAKANAMWLRGTILSHWTDRPQGLELLERSEDLNDDTIDRAIARSSRAFYLASTGSFERAREILEWPSQIGANSGHHRLAVTNGMTHALLGLQSGNRLLGISLLEKQVALCASLQSTQFRVYGEELLAKFYRLEGEKKSAEKSLKSAQAGRSESKMALTQLEKRRVEKIG